MLANLRINDRTVQMDDASLAELNAVLAKIPLCKETQVDNEWKQVPTNKHLRIIAEFHLVNATMD